MGAQTKLETLEQTIPSDHAQADYLYSAPGDKESGYRINKDYIIPEFSVLLNMSSIDKSKLVWRTMSHLPESDLKSQYRKSASYKRHNGDSTLVHELRNAKWVPQKDGDTTTFVCPCDALRDQLPIEGFQWPKGYPEDAGDEWLKAIEFGKKTREQKAEDNQRYQQAKDRGYDSVAEAEEVDAIYNDFKEQGGSLQQLREKINPQERRTKRLIIELGNAPTKEYEQRARRVRVSRGAIEPKPYLTADYTDGNQMVCQMCEKKMPFKKRNNHEDYFEAVEALRKDHFPIEHRAQYLAFCPVCAAKYKEYVKKDRQARQTLYNALKDSDVPKISLQTNSETICIWFAEKHWNDLRAVLYFYENVYNPENSTD